MISASLGSITADANNGLNRPPFSMQTKRPQRATTSQVPLVLPRAVGLTADKKPTDKRRRRGGNTPPTDDTAHCRLALLDLRLP